MKIVLYSCIVNKRDNPKIIEYRDNELEYVLFSDVNVNAPGWDVRPIVFDDKDPVRTARYHKHHPFDLFPDADYTIWLDSTHWTYTSVLPLVKNEFSLMKHFSRKTVKDEVNVCANIFFDEPKILKKQYQDYIKEGFPDKSGLYSTTCLVRKNTDNVKMFQKMWWNEICKYSKRDQISFPYCLWKFKMNYDIIPGFCRGESNEFFKMISHHKKFQKFF